MADTAVEAPHQEAQIEKEPLTEKSETNGHTAAEATKLAENTSSDQAKKPEMADQNDHSTAKPDSEEKRDSRTRHDNRDSGRGRGRGHGRFHQKGRSHDDHKSKKGFSSHRNGKYDRAPYGNRSNLISEEKSSDPVQIRKQVEFYFSDSNLPADKFLFNLVSGHENKPVPLTVIHNFKRMRHFQPFSAVVEALRDSSTLSIVETEKEKLDDDADDKEQKDAKDESTKEFCVQRKTPLPQGTTSTQAEVQKIYENAAMARSVYVKGFGDEVPTTQFDIEAFFSEYGHTNAVRLRRLEDKTFKGSVFVEFDSEATAKNFLALDPPPKYHGNNLIIKSKKDYCNGKIDDINEGRIRADESKKPAAPASGERDWRERREEDRKKGFPPLEDKSYDGKKTGGKTYQGAKKHQTTKAEHAESSHKEELTAGENEDAKADPPTRKRSHDDSAADDEDKPAAKKVATEGAASSDKADENIVDAPPPAEDKVQDEEKEAVEADEGADIDADA